MGARNYVNKFFRLLPVMRLFIFLSHATSVFVLISIKSGNVSAQSSGFNEARFAELVDKVEADAIELARKVEELYQNRCEATLLADCFRGNYEHCMSTYPEQTCPGGIDLNTPECGDGFTCSTLYSFSTTSVALPRVSARGPDRNPTDPQVIETICFTKALDDYFKQKRAEDEAFWDELGFQPNFMYFGSHNGGAFRLSPATHYSSCNTFDPRLRPWYVAASSGPKNISKLWLLTVVCLWFVFIIWLSSEITLGTPILHSLSSFFPSTDVNHYSHGLGPKREHVF